MVRFDITRRGVVKTVAAALGGLLTATGPASGDHRGPLDRYIVGVTSGHADVAEQAADRVYRHFDFGGVGEAVSGWFSPNALEGLERNPHVRYIEAEGIMEAIDHTVDEDDGDPTEEQVLPWGIDRVDADMAHHGGETGSGSSIAIIDTGIDPNHETLAVAGGEAFTDCDGSCEEPWDDDHGHGTHCAGTANARDNSIGVVGVSTAAEMYAVKVLDGGGGGTFSDVAAGIEWTANEGIDVGSLSLGGSHSEVVQDACEYAYHDKGTLLVAAAGNDGPRPNSVSYPAAYDECIAVSAIDRSDDIARFSSRGAEIELAAPGVDVLSSIPGDAYDSWNGTSMACPHVAGAGAQLMEHGYTNDAARELLNETAEDIGLSDTEQGNGLLDVAAALGVEDDEEDDPEDETAIAVATRDVTDVDETSATLHGELTELEGYNEATVYFEWGERGDGLPNATSAQTREATGSFDENLTDLKSDTEYEFRAAAEAHDDTDVGETVIFTTTEDEDQEETSAPVIEQFELTDRSNPRWARVRVDWAVSDVDGELDMVESSLELGDDALDSESTAVSGEEASGDHTLRARDGHGETYDVTLTVTDTMGNITAETKQIDL